VDPAAAGHPAACWGVNLSPAGLLFSVVVVCIVPFRLYVVPLFYSGGRSEEELQEVMDVLDAPHIHEEEDDRGSLQAPVNITATFHSTV